MLDTIDEFSFIFVRYVDKFGRVHPKEKELGVKIEPRWLVPAMN